MGLRGNLGSRALTPACRARRRHPLGRLGVPVLVGRGLLALARAASRGCLGLGHRIISGHIVQYA